MPASRRLLTVAVGLAVLTALCALAIPAIDLIRGASLVVRAADLHGTWQDGLVAVTRHAFITRDGELPSRYGPLRARLYLPATRPGRTLILTAGVHAEGIDEPRMTKLARDFASIGVTVLTPELPDLLEYRITPRLPDVIEDVISYASARRDLAPDGRVGVMGISFSGGLSVVASGRPSVRDHVAFTVAFGGHGDLGRTLRYLCTGIQPDGTRRPPHDYGVVIILLNAADRLVPPNQVEQLRAGIRTFLRASHIDMVDHAKARRVFGDAILMEATLPEPARTLLHYVNTRDVGRLGPLLLPHVEHITTAPDLSAERSPAPTTPVYLLHGTDDNVIPAMESQLLAEYLRRHGTPVRLLLSPLITHAELDRPSSTADVLDLLSFWGAVLAH